VILAFMLGFFGLLAAMALPEIVAAIRAGEGAEGEAAAAGLLQKVGLVYLLFVAGAILLYAVLIAAVMRALLRPAERRFAYLRLGGDEARLIALIVLLYLLVGAGLLAVFALFGGAGFAIAASGSDTAQSGGMLVLVLLGIAAVCGFVYVGVRLSMAVPMTFAERRIRLFRSWGLTRGRFWPLFGGLALAAITAIMLIYAAELVAVVLFMIGGGGMLAANATAFSADPGAVLAGMGPVLILLGVIVVTIIAAAQIIAQVVMLAPYAAAYRMLAGDAEAAAETFT
jgi:hypothetical protein